MIDTTVQKQLREQLEHLPAEQQHQVLEFARSLVKAKGSGVPGKDLLKFAGTIGAEDLIAIEKAIQEGCEKVNLDELTLVSRDDHFKEIEDFPTLTW
jgi:hypothetical protein